MTEKPTKGTKGFLLYSPFTKDYFFRVYTSEDKKEFTDYDLRFEDLEIEILDKFTSFYEDKEKEENYIDYNYKTLGRKKKEEGNV